MYIVGAARVTTDTYMCDVGYVHYAPIIALHSHFHDIILLLRNLGNLQPLQPMWLFSPIEGIQLQRTLLGTMTGCSSHPYLHMLSGARFLIHELCWLGWVVDNKYV